MLERDERIQLLFCGLALTCDRAELREMLAQLPAGAFAPGPTRSLYAALQSGSRDRVFESLQALGVRPAEGEKAFRSVFRHLRAAAGRQVRRRLTAELDAASRLMQPEQFDDYLRSRLRELQESKP
jgi:hypothetical protein